MSKADILHHLSMATLAAEALPDDGPKEDPVAVAKDAKELLALVLGGAKRAKLGEAGHGVVDYGVADFQGMVSENGCVVDLTGCAFSGFSVRKSANIEFVGGKVTGVDNGNDKNVNMGRVHADCNQIKVREMTFFGAADAEDFKTWDRAKWRNRRNSALLIQSPDSAAVDCIAVGVHSGFFADGKGSHIEGCKVRGFSGDSLRATASETRVSGCYSECSVGAFAPEFHVDFLQMFNGSTDPELNAVRIIGNTYKEWDDLYELHPLRHSAQGVVAFDGPTRDLVISENHITTGHYHGITISGGFDLEITSNECYATPQQTDPRWPHIMVGPSKSGVASSGVLTKGNICAKLKIVAQNWTQQ